MSQSDLNIANISRSLFRAEVNTALQALASVSSGATEPSITYAFQLWADTTSGKLKQRNAANDDWIEKGDLAEIDWGFLRKSNPAVTGLLSLDDGADIASASTVDLTAATGNTVRITGTTAITAFTMNAGQQMELIAVGALPLTYNATTMNINGGVSYTCAAGDRLSVTKDGAGVIRVNVTKQDGTAVVSSSSSSTTAANNPSFNSNSDTNPLTPAWLIGYNATKKFTSADQTMTAGGLLTIAHGLGVVPKRVHLTLKCTTADGTYSLNDLLEIGGIDEGSAQSAGVIVRKDATNLYIRIGGGGILLLNNSGSVFNTTLSNYRLIAVAEA